MTETERLKAQLAQANGAGADIITLITSCVAQDAPEEVHKLAESVLERLLCSSQTEWNKPRWFIHPWERELWRKYIDQELNACASDQPSIDEARRLADGP